MNDKTILALVAMVCVTALETVNMAIFHTDGIILSAVVGAICGLAGYTVKSVQVTLSTRKSR